MSLRVGLAFGPTAEDECQEVVMQDLSSWTATNAVLKAGRGLSSWLFNNVSPPSSPSSPSFFGKACFANERSSYLRSSSQAVTAEPSPPFATTSFINTLPQELLEVVFWEYLYGPTATHPLSKDALQGSYRRIKTMVGTTTTPFTLAHVCSSWRAVVMSSPSLWSNLCAFRPEAQDIPLYEFWLAQSSSCPLDLRIVERGKDEMEEIDSTAYQILSLAFQQSERLRTLHLQLQPDMERFFVTSSTLPPLPLLESITLDIGEWSAEGYEAVSQLFSCSPVLRGAAWGKWCPVTPFIANTRWKDLVNIEFGRVDLVDLVVILPLASSVQSLSIHGLETDSADISSLIQHRIIQLPHLSSLALESYDSPSPLLDLLSAPYLTSLTLPTGLGHAGALDVGWASLTRLVQRSGCRISSLNWTHSCLTDRRTVDSVDIFNAMIHTIFPNLCHLRVGSRVGSGTINALTLRPDSSASTLPCLRSLELRNCNAGINAIGAMMSSRPNLQRVDIQMRHGDGSVKYVFSDAASVCVYTAVEC